MLRTATRFKIAFCIYAALHAGAHAQTPIHVGPAIVRNNDGATVCPKPVPLGGHSDAICPVIPRGTRVTVIAKGLPDIIYGTDMTDIEISVPTGGGSPPVVGWTYAMYLANGATQ